MEAAEPGARRRLVVERQLGIEAGQMFTVRIEEGVSRSTIGRRVAILAVECACADGATRSTDKLDVPLEYLADVGDLLLDVAEAAQSK